MGQGRNDQILVVVFLDYVKLWLGWGRLVIQIIAILTVRWGLTQTCNTGTYYPMT